METLQPLKWDTDFFGFPIAKIVNPDATAEELRQACGLMRARSIALAYWAASHPIAEVCQVAEELGGRMVDEKLTFAAELSDVPRAELPAMKLVQPFHPDMSLNDLKRLAVDSGIYSRFVVDPMFPNDKAIAMFEEWILRSVDKSIADDVLVIEQDARIAGMATVVSKTRYVSIGLVAVAKEYRGRQFGEALIRSAQNWCRDRGISQIQVTTQSVNSPARRLYQKCHFDLKSVEHFYHFWNPDIPLASDVDSRRALA